jgi:hypothetical protein
MIMDKIMEKVVIFLREHFIETLIIGFVCVTSTYVIINVLVIDPKNQEIERQKGNIEELRQYISDSPESRVTLKDYERLRQENQQLQEKISECCKEELCQGSGVKQITIDDQIFIVSITDIWEREQQISLKVSSPISQESTETRPLREGDMQELIFQNVSYVLTVMYVNIKDACVRISMEKVKEG